MSTALSRMARAMPGKWFWVWLCCSLVVAPAWVYADKIGVLNTEPDGTPSKAYAPEIVWPNGTATVSGGKVTIDLSALGGGDMSTSTYDTDANDAVDVAAGGTNAHNATDARTNLGLVIGTNVQAYHAMLGRWAAYSDPGAAKLLFWQDSDNSFGSVTLPTGMDLAANGTISYLPPLATALAANGANCSAGQAPLGVDASGAVESCFAVQASDATLTALAGLTIADVSIVEGTGADAMAVVTSGGALRYLRSNSGNTALEFSATINGSGIDIHGTTAETSIADDDEILIYDASASANRMMTKGNFVAGITSSGIILDLADDGSNESTSLGEVATSGDTNAIFTEPTANKLLIDLSKAWPLADLATTVTVADTTDTTSYVGLFESATGSLGAKTDAGITYNAGTGVLTATGFAGPLVGNVTGAVTGNASTATALAANPADCSANQFANAIAASGALTCAQPATADLSDASGIAMLADNEAVTGSWSFGNADTDTLTVRSLLVGGNSRAVWIAGSAPTPTYATGTTDLYVADAIEAAGIIYGSSFVSTSTGDSYLTMGVNSGGLALGANSIAFDNDVLKYRTSAVGEKTFFNLEDNQVVAGSNTFTNVQYFGSAAATGSFRIYDGSDHYVLITSPSISANYTLTLPTTDGTSGQYLKTDGSGALSWDAPTATAHGSDTYVQFNDGGSALGSDAGFTFDKTASLLLLGKDTLDGQLKLYNDLAGGDGSATVIPNSAQTASSAITITLPTATGTLAVLGANTFTGNQALDDGTGASPSLTFQDGTDETAVFSKVDAGYLTITTVAGDGVSVRVGNLTVGDGTPTQTLDGEDFYVNGLAEIDGVLYADGGLTAAGAFTAAGATSSIPMVVGTGTASGITAAGQMYFESDTEILTIGDGATSIGLDMAPNVVYTFPAATSTLARTDAGQTFTGVQAFTSPTIATAIVPASADGATLGLATAEFSDLFLADGGVIYFQNDQSVYLTPSAGTLTLTGALVTSGAVSPSAANGAALGSATAEWADLFLHDGAVIYGQADQSATLTSSASLWTANNFASTGYVAIGSDPADAGALRLDNGAAIAWEDGTEATITHVNDTGLKFNLPIILANDETIANTTDTQIVFTSNGNEDLILDLDTATDNEVSVSSSTGVTQVNFSALNLVTTGSILGAVNVVVTTDGSESPTAAQMYGSMFIADHATATSDTTYTLPAAAAGMSACFYDNGGGAGGIIVNPDDADVILLDGTAMAAGEAAHSPGVAGDGANGDFICMMAIDTTNWITLGKSGTWVQETP